MRLHTSKVQPHFSTKLIMFKKILISVFVFTSMLLMCPDVNAQQDATYTQYMFQPLVYNPAYAGSRGNFSGTAIYRSQWSDIEKAPTTVSLGVHGKMGQSNSAVGLWLENDQTGFSSKIRAYVNYAYHVPFNRGKLSLGIQGGMLNFSERRSEAITNEDDIIFEGNLNGYAPNFGAGIYYYSEDFFVGASVPHILNNTISSNGSSLDNYTQTRHYFATAGVVIPFGNNVKFRPTALLKFVETVSDSAVNAEIQAPMQLDATAHFLFKDALWLGVAARTGTINPLESVDFLLEYQFNQKLRLGYSYDHSLTELRSGSHEIMLGYDVFRDQSRVLTPRYF